MLANLVVDKLKHLNPCLRESSRLLDTVEEQLYETASIDLLIDPKADRALAKHFSGAAVDDDRASSARDAHALWSGWKMLGNTWVGAVDRKASLGADLLWMRNKMLAVFCH